MIHLETPTTKKNIQNVDVVFDLEVYEIQKEIIKCII